MISSASVIIRTEIYNSNLRSIIEHIISDCQDHGSAYANVQYCIDIDTAADGEIMIGVQRSQMVASVLDKYDSAAEIKRWFAARIKKIYASCVDDKIMWNLAYKALKHGKPDNEYDSAETSFYTPNGDMFSLNDILFVYMKFRCEWSDSLTVPNAFAGTALDPITTELVEAHRKRMDELNHNEDYERSHIERDYDVKREQLRKWYTDMCDSVRQKFSQEKDTETANFESMMKSVGLHVMNS